MAKWLKITLISLIIALFILVSVWFLFFSGILDKTKKYSYDDLMDMYNIGYNNGTKTVVELNNRITNLELSIESKNQIIVELQTEIVNNEQIISNLGNANSELNSTIEILNNQIENLQTEIVSLNDLIERLRSELLEYQNTTEMVYVSFYVDESIYKSYGVRLNGSILLDIEEPVKDGYSFVGWMKNSEFIDISTYSFVEDTRLDAKFAMEKIPDGTYDLSFTANYINSINYQDNGIHTKNIQMNFVVENGEVSGVYHFGFGNTIVSIASYESISNNEYKIIFRIKESSDDIVYRELGIIVKFDSLFSQNNTNYLKIETDETTDYWYYQVFDSLHDLIDYAGLTQTTYTNMIISKPL